MPRQNGPMLLPPTTKRPLAPVAATAGSSLNGLTSFATDSSLVPGRGVEARMRRSGRSPDRRSGRPRCWRRRPRARCASPSACSERSLRRGVAAGGLRAPRPASAASPSATCRSPLLTSVPFARAHASGNMTAVTSSAPARRASSVSIVPRASASISSLNTTMLPDRVKPAAAAGVSLDQRRRTARRDLLPQRVDDFLRLGRPARRDRHDRAALALAVQRHERRRARAGEVHVGGDLGRQPGLRQDHVAQAARRPSASGIACDTSLVPLASRRSTGADRDGREQQGRAAAAAISSIGGPAGMPVATGVVSGAVAACGEWRGGVFSAHATRPPISTQTPTTRLAKSRSPMVPGR